MRTTTSTLRDETEALRWLRGQLRWERALEELRRPAVAEADVALLERAA